MECCTVQVTHVRDQSSRTMATVPVYKVLHCKLHAAAPDLLGALEDLVGGLTDDHETCDICIGQDEDGEDLPEGQHNPTSSCGRAVATIAKVKGAK